MKPIAFGKAAVFFDTYLKLNWTVALYSAPMRLKAPNGNPKRVGKTDINTTVVASWLLQLPTLFMKSIMN